jgi:CPA2 family monovalent cation:H+ antiporter-2
MHGIDFLQDLAVVMIVAAVVTLLFHWLKQPVVLGYILAGVIIGPHTPPFPLIHDLETIKTLSELGVIFLMFSLGLEFSLRKLKAVGSTAFIAASMEIVLMIFAGYEIGRWFGWSTMDSIFLGAILSVSSTTIIVKALAELGRSKEFFAELIFGILIVEDILAIIMIALLSGIAMTGTLQAAQVAETVGRLAVFLVVALVIGLIAVPRLFSFIARFKSNEMILVTALGLCFGISLLAVKLGYSVALGAFMIGAVIAESREIMKIERLIEPVRDMFSAVFFVAIGLLIEPALLLQYAGPIAIITVVVVVGKVVTCSLGTFVAGNDLRTSLRVGMGLAQIGEFSFIIASLGLTLNVTSSFLYPIAVAVSVITTLLTPYLIKSAPGLVAWFDRAAPQPLVGALELYTQWVGQIGTGKSPAGGFIRKWIWQMALSFGLVAGLFIAATFFATAGRGYLPNLPIEEENLRAILWVAAMILSLPMLIAIFRKLQALGMLIAEISVSLEKGGARTQSIRAVVSVIVVTVGTLAVGIAVLLLSTVLQPPARLLVFLVPVIGLLTVLLWKRFVRVYARAQVALHETLSQPPVERHPAPPAPLPAILRDAQLETVVLPAESTSAGRMIRELKLRTETGASIVGIERDGKSIINPDPDEELRVEDRVLLLGSKNQLAAAKLSLSAVV